MQTGRFFRSRARIFLTMVILAGAAVFLTVGWLGAVLMPDKAAERVGARADIVTIDGLKVFRKLERPPVTFLHSLHTTALGKQNRGCRTCHEQEKNGLSTKFKRLGDESRQAVMDTYHNNCISCHRQTRSAGEKSGPVVCGQCHTPQPTVASSWQPFGFDKSLHYRHAKALDNKCQQCHHTYDEKTKKLVYVKGREGTCRYCHKKEKQEKRISAQQAFHRACIGCHQQRVAKKMAAGPQSCVGCHSAERQAAIEKVGPVPRMKMGQPDAVFVKVAADQPPQQGHRAGMRLVPFDHEAHEKSARSCRVCHHEDLASCASCHTVGGSRKGQQIKLETAMHQLKSRRSCRGCHAAAQAAGSCAGCHTAPTVPVSQDAAACVKCHKGPLPGDQSTVSATLSKAVQLLKAVKEMFPEAISDDRIPEKVTIAGLTEEYQAVELPHRKIVHALRKDVAASRLAGYFHTDAATLCQGCHHNSPAQQKPPACKSCHGKPFGRGEDPLKPGLMGAYHQQCMTCHKAMGIEKPASRDCTACHKKRTAS